MPYLSCLSPNPWPFIMCQKSTSVNRIGGWLWRQMMWCNYWRDLVTNLPKPSSLRPPWVMVSTTSSPTTSSPWWPLSCATLEILQQSPVISRVEKIQSWVSQSLAMPRMRENKLLRKQGDLCIIKVSSNLNFYLVDIISISLNIIVDKSLNYTSFRTNRIYLT